MCKVSIIVPIYNTGNLLNKCIESILNQSLKDIELLLVDDGSTDNSGQICDEYAKKDKRIKVIHKTNEGVSIARNAGIAKARGEYIGFVDSDDWIDSNMYCDLYCIAMKRKADIVMCDAVTIYGNSQRGADTITQLSESIALNKADITPSLLMELAGAAWRCIYKKELLVDNNIMFPDGLKFSEDRIFNILAMGKCNKLYYLKQSYYNRFIRDGSAVNKYYDNMIDIVLDARSRIMNAIDIAWGGDNAYKDMYENQTIAHCFGAINNEFYKDAQGSILQKYKNIKKLCKTPEIRNAITVLNRTDIRSKFIIHKLALPLCLLSIMLNKKHGR